MSFVIITKGGLLL